MKHKYENGSFFIEQHSPISEGLKRMVDEMAMAERERVRVEKIKRKAFCKKLEDEQAKYWANYLKYADMSSGCYSLT